MARTCELSIVSFVDKLYRSEHRCIALSLVGKLFYPANHFCNKLASIQRDSSCHKQLHHKC